MYKQPSLKINIIMNMLLTISSIIFPIITFPYVSRILLPEGTGIIAFVTSVVSYFSMAAMLGIPTYGIRICAQLRDDHEQLSRTVQEILMINAIMTVLTYIFFFLSLCLVPQFRQEQTLFLICGSTMFFNLLGVEWLYKALEQYRYITVRSLIFKLLSLILMFLLIHKKEDYVIYGGITVLSGVGSNTLNFIHARQHISFQRYPSYNLKKHLKPIFTFFALTVAATIYTNLDIVMLGFMSGQQEVGYYNAAIKIKFILTTFVTSIGAVLLPRISYYVKQKQQEKYQVLLIRAFDFVILSAVPLCIYFIIMSRQTILFLSGPAYEGSVAAMQIIMPTVLFIGLTNIIGIQMLVPLGQEKLVFYSTCAGAVTDLILNLLLIPQFSSVGAAVGTVCAELAVLVFQLWFARKEVFKFLSAVQYRQVFLALVPAAAVLYVISGFQFSGSFAALAVSSASFFSIYLITLILLKYDFKFR